MLLEYFQMIDRVDTVGDDGGSIVCSARVPESSTVFEGHFPGHPLLPATLMIETMAQASGLLLLYRLAFERLPYLIQVDKAKVRNFVEPGAGLMIVGNLIHDGSGFAVTEAELQADGAAIAGAELRFRTMKFPNGELADMFRRYAADVGLPPARN